MNPASVTFNLPSEYLTEDHRRLEKLLSASAAKPEKINMILYDEFRAGILRHIGIEEKVVLPFLRTIEKCTFEKEAQLRLEHGAIGALVVPPPTIELIAALAGLLERHNRLEEDAGTLYSILDECSKEADNDIFDRIMTFPMVPVSRNINYPNAVEPAKRAVARSGHDFNELVDEGKKLGFMF